MSLFDSYPVLESVIVNTKEGKAFRGVVWKRRGGYLVLRNAEILQPSGDRIAVDGEVAIPDRDIEFLQVPRAVS